MRITTLALTLAILAGCQTLDPSERQQYENLTDAGAETVEVKSPAVAGALNLLALGDLYTGEYGAFALDLLLWPFSVLWAVPQGVSTARNLNRKATIAHYRYGDGRGQHDGAFTLKPRD